MNFQQLKIIREAARQDYNLTEVANMLYTSQSGVSRHIRELEEERRKEREMAERMEGLTEAVTRELAFPGGFSIGLIDALLDRAEVFGTGNGDLLRVKLYLKGGPDELEYTVRRVRGGASVCTRRYI